MAVHSAKITAMAKNDFKALMSQIKPELTEAQHDKLLEYDEEKKEETRTKK
jgi:hypothetical protein